jgi:hypothetical protein
MTTVLAFSVLLSTGMARTGNDLNIPHWVKIYIIFPLAFVGILLICWFTRKKD